MTDVSIRVDADNQIGYGHLKRCLTLAETLRKKGRVVSFFVKGDQIVEDIVKSKNFECKLLSNLLTLKEETKEIYKNFPSSISTLVSDIAHPNTLKDTKNLELYLQEINKSFKHVAFDGSGEVSFRKSLSNFNCDILVSPYVGEIKSKTKVSYKELLGTKYFILAKEYNLITKRLIKSKSKNILITCGGSDPKLITANILKALALCKHSRINVRVIIGPGYNKNHIKDLYLLAKQIHHQINFIHSPDNLAEEMYLCDIAISTSGLTKYELAATGTPTILVSIDQYHHNVNKAFSRKASVINLGVAEKVSTKILAENIIDLMHNQQKRNQLSISGQKLVDGNGASRLTNEILNLK